MQDEKKIKLDELPDKGSTPEPEVKIKPIRASKPDPRVEKLKSMNQTERVEALGQRWYFDVPSARYGWMIALGVLLVAEKFAGPQAVEGAKRFSEATGGLLDILTDPSNPIFFLFKHPLTFAVLIPLIFKFKEPSDFFFEITFDGIHSVRNLRIKDNTKPQKVKLKWDEITAVTHENFEKRDILVLHTNLDPAATLIWDIEDVKKKVIKQVVKGLVSNKNAFRIFIEKEVA